jgi:hypothetical protein
MAQEKEVVWRARSLTRMDFFITHCGKRNAPTGKEYSHSRGPNRHHFEAQMPWLLFTGAISGKTRYELMFDVSYDSLSEHEEVLPSGLGSSKFRSNVFESMLKS